MNLLILYGIGRNNNISEKYFKRFIDNFKIFHSNFEIHYFYNKITKISNPRSNEYGQLKPQNSDSFGADFFYCFDNVNSEISNYLEICENIEDIYQDGLKSYANLLSQLYLLKKVAENTSFDKYDSITFIRDDVFITKDLNYKFLKSINLEYSFLPAWSWHNGYNDRFFYTNSEGAKVFSNRLDNVIPFINKNNFLQGEQLLKYSLNLSGIKILPLEIRTPRIRSNNQIILDDNFFWNLLYSNNIIELAIKSLKIKSLKIIFFWRSIYL